MNRKVIEYHEYIIDIKSLKSSNSQKLTIYAIYKIKYLNPTNDIY